MARRRRTKPEQILSTTGDVQPGSIVLYADAHIVAHMHCRTIKGHRCVRPTYLYRKKPEYLIPKYRLTRDTFQDGESQIRPKMRFGISGTLPPRTRRLEAHCHSSIVRPRATMHLRG